MDLPIIIIPMNSLYHIPLLNLALALIPVILVGALHASWRIPILTIASATARMVIQLALIGFALVAIFEWRQPAVVGLLLSLMLVIAAWIALRPIKAKRRELYPKALFSLAVGSLPVLFLIAGGVLSLRPWYEPRYLIPIAGMIFANAMNSLSLAAERFLSEIKKGASYPEARNTALITSLVPITNSLLAVGLVSLPGMMTGQILSGVDPLLAIRYQIMVMCMLYGASGISAGIYLWMMRKSTLAAS